MKLMKFAVVATAALLSSAASAEWYEARTNHFIIISEGTETETVAFAQRLERFDNALRNLQNLPADKAVPDASKVMVYRYGDTRTIGNLAGSMGVAGFYIPRAAYPVAFTPAREYFEPGRRERGNERTKLKPETVLFHEYTHHFMLHTFPATYPSWYIEGFAEVNATIDLNPDGTFMVGLPANHRSTELFRLPQLHVRKLLDPNFKYEDFIAVVQKYSVGWLLTHYLTFNKSRSGQLKTYLRLLGEGKPGLEAAEQAFGDLEKLNAELIKYKTTNMPAARVVPANTRMPDVKVRRLDAIEEKYVLKRIQLARGVSRAQAKKLAPDLLATAAAEPKSLPAQLLAAESGLDAEDFVGAAQAADRALAIDPNSIEALIYKARTLIEPKEGPAERFKQARSYLVKARGVDKDDPRPLIQYYASYRRAPERPIPDSAAAALDNAYDLARHDSYFRMILTRQLLEEGRVPQAIQVLGPLAYSFDGRDQERNIPGKVMAKLQANEAAEGLKILNKEIDKMEGLVDEKGKPKDDDKDKDKGKDKGGED
ncbi:hypothetical protein [Novosphingobium sp. TH158]|uniref:hypothetical protein n=1 Tax=Novosphingobium sp. TH158 TaxID=2067455 RepID=UPI000C79D578|nr:hypothetical protein [Novosphingobium sp. TH158]PLK25602.1 hypothetical protein C0V78_00860 [Novosphingobium sp. TH158]